MQKFLVLTFVATIGLPALSAAAGRINPQKDQEKEVIGGFVMFRQINNRMEYLLLEKASEPGDWSPPKGHAEGDEIPVNAAYRETREETALSDVDYQPFLGYEHYFEYETKDDILKQVTLWPAHLLDPYHPIVISDESRDYTWVNSTRLTQIIKKQYKETYLQVILQLNCHFTGVC